MSAIIEKFYNIFWQSKPCQNLFLLSKEELLDTITIGTEDNPFTCSSNKIIISKVQYNEDDITTIKLRNESSSLVIDETLEEKISFFKPIVEDFLSKKFEKAIGKVVEDFETNGWGLIISIIFDLADEENKEKKIVQRFQDYGFIPKNLNSFSDLEQYVESSLVLKKHRDVINEQTVNTFFEGVKYIKDFYINYSYKRLYSTNQILSYTLNSEDEFESRLKLYHHLYDSKILLPSNEDAFVECSYCDPDTYKGTLQLKMNPNKLDRLICPICNNALSYFVPYKLATPIYQIVKQKDGLLLDALCYKLRSKNFYYKTNKIFLGDIEIDCLFEGVIDDHTYTYVIEVKMFKINTELRKLKSKVKKSFGKLLEDVNRIQTLEEYQSKEVFPVLLVNINDANLLEEIAQDLQITNSKINNSYILNIETLESVLGI